MLPPRSSCGRTMRSEESGVGCGSESSTTSEAASIDNLIALAEGAWKASNDPRTP